MNPDYTAYILSAALHQVSVCECVIPTQLKLNFASCLPVPYQIDSSGACAIKHFK